MSEPRYLIGRRPGGGYGLAVLETGRCRVFHYRLLRDARLAIETCSYEADAGSQNGQGPVRAQTAAKPLGSPHHPSKGGK